MQSISMARCCLHTGHIHGQVLSSHRSYPWPGVVFTQVISMARCCLHKGHIHGQVLPSHSSYPWPSAVFTQPISMARWCLHTAHIHGQVVSPHSPYPYPCGVSTRPISTARCCQAVFTQPISRCCLYTAHIYSLQVVFTRHITRCCLHTAHIQVLSSHSRYPGVVFTQPIFMAMACCQAVCTSLFGLPCAGIAVVVHAQVLSGMSVPWRCYSCPCPGVLSDLSASCCSVRPVHVLLFCQTCPCPAVLSDLSMSGCSVRHVSTLVFCQTRQ